MLAGSSAAQNSQLYGEIARTQCDDLKVLHCISSNVIVASYEAFRFVICWGKGERSLVVWSPIQPPVDTKRTLPGNITLIKL